MATQYASATGGIGIFGTYVGGLTYGTGIAESNGLFYTYSFGGVSLGGSIKNVAIPAIAYGTSSADIQSLTGDAVGVDIAVGLGIQLNFGIEYTDWGIPYFSGSNSGGAELSLGGAVSATRMWITSGPYVALDKSTT